ncbi:MULTISPECIES: tryptophan synthase subunit beta [Pseudomonas]|uniref:tryptophan synthase subunit beta n=1 Tax=Pseudomonas TaxID=286 RepID=UPI000D6F6AFE|nr:MULTISPECIES: tryptophan synthase subunit beta [unclassified Pseudomonas]MED5608073.1 tryptophan synthase subunit beta [Pseudomonas sp. JH-2]PWU31557.1 tryptophan synthase subunit beta [Pseudomonas sp. RW407]
MPYIQRDAEGRLIRVESAAFAGMSGSLADGDEEVRAWREAESSLHQLQQSDLEMIRVLEDLISVLMAKGVIRITDLPEAARSKLLSRTQAREALGGLHRLIDEDEDGGLI